MSKSTAVQKLDAGLYESVADIDILSAISPRNYRQQKVDFLKSNYSQVPKFSYAKPDFDAFKRKRALYALPVEDLQDEDLATLYRDVIESYTDKFDQFRTLGSNEFLYDSLRYYGEPSKKDIANAKFILHLPEDDKRDNRQVDAEGVKRYLEDFAKQEGYTFELSMDEQMIANALVSGTKIKINPGMSLPERELEALAHHELGVHLVTTLNAYEQPLKILALGTPLNTMTQEGLAILCEYLCGHLTLSRLKVLALRVLAVESLIKDKDFRKTFLLLKEQYGVLDDLAFTITARVYRGGGFTKDYLYLKGFHQVLNAYAERKDFLNLLSGKTSLKYLNTISRLVEKGYLKPPRFISPAIRSPGELDSIQSFIANAIR